MRRLRRRREKWYNTVVIRERNGKDRGVKRGIEGYRGEWRGIVLVN